MYILGEFIDSDYGLKAKQLEHYNYLLAELTSISKVGAYS